MKQKKFWKRGIGILLAAAMGFTAVPDSYAYAEKLPEEAEDILPSSEETKVESETVTEVESELPPSEEEQPVSVLRLVEKGEPSESGYQEMVWVDENGNEVEGEYISEEPGRPKARIAFPARYSMKDAGELPAIRDQGKWGTCWAHAALSSVETNMIKKGLANASDVDYSERHLAYFAHRKNTNLQDGKDDEDSKYGWYGSGYATDAIAMLANWYGAAAEASYPYNPDGTMVDLEEGDRASSVCHLTDADFLSTPEDIKKAVMEDGAVTCSYYSYSGVGAGKNVYNARERGANHDVSIVGWDDNYAKTNFNENCGIPPKDGRWIIPAKDGAWMCRNSQNGYSENEKYFWISYEDVTLRNFWSYKAESVSNYDKIYAYDGAVVESMTEYSKSANVFTAEAEEDLCAVSFWTRSNYNYEIEIWLQGEGAMDTPSDGILKYTQSGSLEYPGYHTIPLDKRIPLNQGRKYAVSVELASKDGKQPYTYIEKGSSYYAETGQSFLWTGSQWEDATATSDEYGRNKNVLIKAFTKKVDRKEDPGFSYRELQDGTLEITGFSEGNSNRETAEILPVIAGKRVTSIGARAFQGCSSLSSITLPDGITAIEDSAFSECKNIESIILPLGVKKIGDYAFSYCTALSSISFPNGLTSIGNYTFKNCSSLSDIEWPISIKTAISYGGPVSENSSSRLITIGEGAFSGCSSLSSITLPEEITTVGDYAFANCTALIDIDFSSWDAGNAENIKNIVGGCSSLKIVTTPKRIKTGTYIGLGGIFCSSKGDAYDRLDSATPTTTVLTRGYRITYNLQQGSVIGNPVGYASCTDAFTLKNPTREGYTFLGWTGSNGNTPQITVRIEKGMTGDLSYTANWKAKDFGFSYRELQDGTIEITGFSKGNTNRERAEIPSVLVGKRVTFIGAEAFYNNKDLKSITLPEGLTTIGASAFYGCSSLSSIKESTLPGVMTANSYGSPDIILPGGLKTIGGSAFHGCSSLKDIILPEGLTSIGDYAFSYCSSLRSINLSGWDAGNATNIHSIFYECRNLEEITTPKRIKAGSYITLPNIFYDSDGKGYERIDSATPVSTIPLRALSIITPAASSGKFQITYDLKHGSISGKPNNNSYGEDSDTFTLKIPTRTGCTFLGWTGSNGTTPQVIVTVAKGTTGDLSYTANWEGNLYGQGQFSYKQLADGTYEITRYAEDSTVKDIVIPSRINGKQVTSIGTGAFWECSGLRSIEIPKGVRAVGESAFANCGSLESIKLPVGVTSIGGWLVTNCNNLNSIIIPDGEISIGDGAFSSCLGLKSIDLSGWDAGNATDIEYMLYESNNLAKIKTPKRIKAGSSINLGNTFYDSGNHAYTRLDSTTPKTTILLRKFSISYDLQQGNAVENTKAYTIDTGTFTLNNPTREGYTFLGWTGSNGNTPQMTVNIEKGTTGDRSYTANWEEDPFAHAHVFGTAYQSDGNSHWKICECGEKAEIENHTYSTIYQSNDSQHWKECVCGKKSEIGSHIYSTTYQSNGNEHWKACVCGKKTELGSHFYSATYQSNSIEHWKACVCGQKSEAGIHSFTWIIDREATITAIGLKHEECSVCRLIRNENTTIEKLPHTHDYGTAYKSDASVHWKECVCGQKSEGESHAFAWVIDREATAAAIGLKHEECSVCKRTRNENTVIEKKEPELFRYRELKDNKLEITGFTEENKDAKEAEIPSEINGKPVTSIGGWAFEGCSSLSGIVIPEGVASIGNGAFRGCSSLSSIDIPKSVTSIGEWAFRDCVSLKSISLPEGTSFVGEWAFKGCTGLKSIDLSGWDAENAEEVQGILYGCRSLAKIKTPKRIKAETYINLASVFYDSENNEYGRLDSTTPGSAVLLRKFGIAYDLQQGSVDGNPDSYTMDTDEVTLQNPTRQCYRFLGWTGSNGEEPETAVKIEKGTTGDLSYTANWEENHAYGSEWKSDGETHWKECECGKKTEAENHAYSAAYRSDESRHWKECECGKKAEEENHAYSAEYRSDERGHWRECKCGKQSALDGHAFAWVIDREATTEETGLKHEECSVCKRTRNENTVIEKKEPVLFRYRELKDHKLEIMGFAEGNKDAREAVIPSEIDGKPVASIGRGAFGGCGSLSGIDIPEGVSAIGDEAFRGCSSLSSISLPESVTSIGEWAFRDCVSLKSISLPEGISFIGDEAFKGCAGLTSIDLSGWDAGNAEEVQGILYGCRSLAKIKTPKKIKAGTYINLASVFYDSENNEYKRLDSATPGAAVLLKKFSIAYNLQQGSVEGNPDSYMMDADTFTLQNPTRQCYQFLGWTGSNGAEPETAVKIEKGTTGDLSYTANWEENHAYGSEWKNDGESHWKECICGKQSALESHTFTWVIDREATTTEAGSKHEECDVCGIKRNENTVIEKLEIPHVHSYGTVYRSDESSHWKECECGEKAEAESHAYGTDYQTSESGHWKKCICGKQSIPESHIFIWVVDREATTTETGSKHEECDACGVKRNENTVIEKLEIPHVHSYGTAYRSDESSHWKECECGEKAEAEGHAYGTGYQTSESGHWKECKCGKQSALGSHIFTWMIDSKATTTETGSKHEECGICGVKRNENTVIEKLEDSHEHSYGTEYQSDEASHWKECLCGEAAEIAEHIYAEIVVKAATEKNGSIIEKCTVCGNIKQTLPIYSPKTVVLPDKSYTYTGKAIKPVVTVEDCNGDVVPDSNYKVSYNANKSVGQASVLVTFKGNYNGFLVKTFTISPQGTSIRNISARPKGFVIRWKKQDVQTTGYEVCYSTNSGFSKKAAITKTVKNTDTAMSVKNLKAGKKYFVRIRTYKSVKADGKMVKAYSEWSETLSVTTKK